MADVQKLMESANLGSNLVQKVVPKTASRGSSLKGMSESYTYTLSFRLLLLVIMFVTSLPVVRLFGDGVGSVSWATTSVLIMYKYAYGNFQTGCNTQSDAGCTITWPGVTQAAQANVTAMIWMSLYIAMAYQIIVIRSKMPDKAGISYEIDTRNYHLYRVVFYNVSIVLGYAPMLYFAGYTTVNDVLLFTLAVNLWLQQPHRVLKKLQETQKTDDQTNYWRKFVPNFIMGLAYDILLWAPLIISANSSAYTSSTVWLQQAMYAGAALGILTGTGFTICMYPLYYNYYGKNAERAHRGLMVANEIGLILGIWIVDGFTARALFYQKQSSY